MKFRMFVSNGDCEWQEDYDRSCSDASQEALRIVELFNNTLRPHERPRTLLRVEMIDLASRKDHTWDKMNLVTVFTHGHYFDVLRCRVCGVTAKRYGLHNIVLDAQYRKAKVYQR